MVRGHRLATAAAAVALSAGLLVAAGCGSSSSGGTSSGSATLNGAGATFPEPLYVQWSGQVRKDHPGLAVNYQGIGSGGGIEQFTAKTTDFGASDAPMSDTELAKAEAAGGRVLHIPMVLGSVVVSYNLNGVKNLRLDGPTLANIFLGQIKKWNDPAIAALNPGVSLPSADIRVVHRSDSSGTSYIFTGYLSSVSPAWKTKVGQNKSPEWPTGIGGEGNDGVAAAVKQTNGSIGYNEIAYAIENKIPFATLKNASGEFITPSLAATTAAGQGVSYPADLRFSLLNSKAKGAYPIVSATWQLVWQDPAKAGQSAAKATSLTTWLNWELTTGQGTAASLNYARLPAKLQALALAKVKTIGAGK